MRALRCIHTYRVHGEDYHAADVVTVDDQLAETLLAFRVQLGMEVEPVFEPADGAPVNVAPPSDANVLSAEELSALPLEDVIALAKAAGQPVEDQSKDAMIAALAAPDASPNEPPAA